MRILVAEDYLDLAEIYKVTLEARGHSVITTRDGIECIQEYKNYLRGDNNEDAPFDVVILDQQMPGMDGIDVAKEIQKLNQKQRIIFVTGYGSNVVKKLKEINENVEIMNKPFTVEALINQIEGWSRHMWQEQVKRGFKSWDGYSGTSTPVGPSRAS